MLGDPVPREDAILLVGTPQTESVIHNFVLKTHPSSHVLVNHSLAFIATSRHVHTGTLEY